MHGHYPIRGQNLRVQELFGAGAAFAHGCCCISQARQIDAPRCCQASLRGGDTGEAAGDVALEAADGFGFGLAFGAASLEIATSLGVVGEAGDHDAPEGAVRLTVTAAAESMPLLFAAGGIEWCGAAESGEGSLVVDPTGVLTGGDEQRAGGVGADPNTVDCSGAVEGTSGVRFSSSMSISVSSSNTRRARVFTRHDSSS